MYRYSVALSWQCLMVVSTMVQCSHNGSQYCQLLQISTMLSKLTGAECGSHGDIW